MPAASPGPDRTRFSISYIIVALLAILLLQDVWSRVQGVTPLPYSEFERLLKENRIEEVIVSSGEIRGTLKEPIDGKKQFVTNRVEPDLANELEPARGQVLRPAREAPSWPRSSPGSCPWCCSLPSGCSSCAGWPAGSDRAAG